MRRIVLIFCLVVFTDLTSSAQTDPLTGANGLYNTGVNNNGLVLSAGQEDAHWTVTAGTTLATLNGNTYEFNGSGYKVDGVTNLGLNNLSSLAGNAPSGYLTNPISSVAGFLTPFVDGNPNQFSTKTTGFTKTGGPNAGIPDNGTYNYSLNLSNIPLGSLVTINIKSAAVDDKFLSITANGKSPIFNSSATSVFNQSYNNSGAQNLNQTFQFVAGTSNTLTFVVDNTNEGATGIALDLTGSTYTVESGLPHGPGITYDVDYALFAPYQLGLLSNLAFNNVSFLNNDLDDYLEHRRNEYGQFQAQNGIDVSGLNFTDPTVASGINETYSHLLAWTPSAPANEVGLLSDTVSPLFGVDMKDTRNAPVASAQSSQDPWNVFLRGTVVLAQNLSQGINFVHSDTTTGDFQVGADYQLTPHFLVGAMLGYAHTQGSLDENGSTVTADGYSPAIYASYTNQKGWYANGLFSYTRNEYQLVRSIQVPGISETALSNPGGNQENGYLSGGYDYHLGKNWTIGPTVGLQYTHWGLDKFQEQGANFLNLQVGRQDADSLRSRLGGRVYYAEMGGGVLWRPFLDASWQHEYMDQGHSISSSFDPAIGGGNFTFQTPKGDRESALITTGTDIDINRDVTVFANYRVQAGEQSYFGQAVQAGVKIGF